MTQTDSDKKTLVRRLLRGVINAGLDLLRRHSTEMACMALLFTLMSKWSWYLRQQQLPYGTRMGVLAYVADDLFFFAVLIGLLWFWEMGIRRKWLRPIPALLAVPILLYSIVNAFWLVVKGEPLVYAGLVLGWGKVGTAFGILGSELPVAEGVSLLVLLVLIAGLPVLCNQKWTAMGRAVRTHWGTLAIPGTLIALAGLGWAGSACSRPDMIGWQLVAGNGIWSVVRQAISRPEKSRWPTTLPDPAPGDGHPDPAVERPNILLVFIESGSFTRTSLAEGRSDDPTPFLKQLAAQGLQASHMRTVALATTLALLSGLCGRYPGLQTALAETSDEFPMHCLPSVLAARGYATAFFQSATGAYDDAPRMMARMGFETFVPLEELCPRPERLGYLAGDDLGLVEPVREWVRRQTRPWFAVVMTSMTHHPWELPGRLLEQHPEAADWPDQKRYEWLLGQADLAIRTLVDQVDALPGRARPIVIVTADHGEAFGERGKYVHDSVHWEEGLRVPFVLRVDGRVVPGTIDHANHSLIDLAPTVLDLAHIAYLPERFDGQSLFRETDEQRRRYFSCWFEELCVGYIQGHNKIVYIPMLDSWAVYDLEKDPGEVRPDIDPPEWQAQARQVSAWYNEHRFFIDGLTWPQRSLFAGHWRCETGREKCRQADATRCDRELDPAAITRPLAGGDAE